jgi:hypothetical protein
VTHIVLLGTDGQVRHRLEWPTAGVPNALRWEGSVFVSLRREGDRQQRHLYLETPVVEVPT